MGLDPTLAEYLHQRAAKLPPVDEAQVQASVQEFLARRGRVVADGLDLGKVNDTRLVELGRLDCLAKRPDLTPDLAVAVAWMRDRHWRPVGYGSRNRFDPRGFNRHHDYCRAQKHRHAANERCDFMDLDRAQAPPEALPQIAPEHAPDPAPTGTGQGRGRRTTRGGAETPVQNGKKDPITEYLRNDRDDDEQEWWSS
jgi:hypothetical protein